MEKDKQIEINEQHIKNEFMYYLYSNKNWIQWILYVAVAFPKTIDYFINEETSK